MVANSRVDPRRCHSARQKPKEPRSTSALQTYISKGNNEDRAQAVARFRNFATNALDENGNAKAHIPVDVQGLDLINQKWETLPQHLRDSIIDAVERHSASPLHSVDQSHASIFAQPSGNDTLPVKQTPFLEPSQSHGGMVKIVSQPSLGLSTVARPRKKSKNTVKARDSREPPLINTVKRKACLEDDSDASDDQQRRLSKQCPPISFRIDDEEKVVAFLYSRFLQVQQNAGKVIAKAWIKAICPKKQGNYPYVDSNPRPEQPRAKKAYEGPPRIPTFWPDIKKCRHREPDHTNKKERTYLLVHLVRLRWTKTDWIESNAGCEVPGYVKAGSWVEFLKEAFPLSRLAEITGSTPEKTARRESYMRDIYNVAEQEEVYVQQGKRDGSATFTFEGDFKMIHPDDEGPSRSQGLSRPSENPRLVNTVPSSIRSASYSDDTASTTSKSSSTALAAIPATKCETACPSPSFALAGSDTRAHSGRIPPAALSDPMDDVHCHGPTFIRPKQDSLFDRGPLTLGEQSNRFSSAWANEAPVHLSPQTLYNDTGVPPTWLGDTSQSFNFPASFPTSFAGSPNMNDSLGRYREQGELDPMLQGLSLQSRTDLPHFPAENTRYNTVYGTARAAAPGDERLQGLPQSEVPGSNNQQSYTRGRASADYPRRPTAAARHSHPDDMLYSDHFTGAGRERNPYAIDVVPLFHSSQQTIPFQDMMPGDAFTEDRCGPTWS